MYTYEIDIRCGDSGAIGTFTCDAPTAEEARKQLLKGRWVEFDTLNGGVWKIKQSKIWSVKVQPAAKLCDVAGYLADKYNILGGDAVVDAATKEVAT